MDDVPRSLLLTRAQVARELQVSIATVRRLEKKKLHPKRDRDGVMRFDRREVIELAGQRGREVPIEGKVAARVFSLFDRGASLREVVQESEQPPVVVRMLWLEYQTPLGEIPDHAARAGGRAELEDERHDRELAQMQAGLTERRARRRSG
jgi:hypothetical protein